MVKGPHYLGGENNVEKFNIFYSDRQAFRAFTAGSKAILKSSES